MSYKILFRGTPAYTTNHADEEDGKCRFRQKKTNEDAPLYEVDLTKHPLMARSWDPTTVEVDVERSDGGCSYLYPEEGDIVAEGCLYVSNWKWRDLNLEIPAGWKPYELAAYYYSLDMSGTGTTAVRYHGFHAEIIAKDGPVLTCKVWGAGHSNVTDAATELSLTLTNTLHCDALLASRDELWEERITLDRELGFSGAIFLELNFAATFLLGVPKLPASLGVDKIDAATGGQSTWMVEGKLPPPRGARLRPCDMCKGLEARRKGKARVLASDTDAGAFDLGEVITVSSQHATGGLIPIQHRIMNSDDYGPLFLVSDLHALHELLQWAVTCRPRRIRRCLDLVGHSTGKDNLLLLGTTEIDFASERVSGVFKNMAKEGLFKQLGIQKLRLIGCLTNREKRAKETLISIGNCLGVDVRGICSLVNPWEFGPEGFKHPGLRPTVVCPVESFPDAARDPFDPTEISGHCASAADRAYVSHDANFLGAVAETIDAKRGWKLPGVLMKPLAEVVVVSVPSEDTCRPASSQADPDPILSARRSPMKSVATSNQRWPGGIGSMMVSQDVKHGSGSESHPPRAPGREAFQTFEILGRFELIRVCQRDGTEILYRVTDPAGLQRHVLKLRCHDFAQRRR